MLPAIRKTTILVVEDEPALRELYRTALMVAGFQVVAVEDGLDALRRIESEPPDLVVLDVALPRLSGREVHKELRSRAATAHIPVVVVSGTDTRNFGPRNFDCVLRKPVSVDALLRSVENCLRKAGG